MLWFAVGPAETQLAAIRLVTPIFGSMATIGLWRIGGNRRLPAPSIRFWRILSIAMAIYTAGMFVDVAALGLDRFLTVPLAPAGEAVLYPIAGGITIVALSLFPTAAQARVERVKIGLDVAIVLFGSATFVWYFLASPRWEPVDGWQKLAEGLVLPALTLVSGFAVLRIVMAGANVIGRSTVVCLIAASTLEALAILIKDPMATSSGRVAGSLQILGLATCVVGVQLERRTTPRPVRAWSGWRRPLAVLPYLALTANVVLLLSVIDAHLDYRRWFVALGVLAVCVVVVARQLASLWDHARLLSANWRLTNQLRHQAYHDQLTGLANRALFTDRVSEALAHAREARTGVGVLFIDLDDFKFVNDSLGHQAGDELLASVADRLSGVVSDSDTLGRLGGDEFAVLVENTRIPDISATAQRVIEALDDPFWISGKPVRAEASVGVAIAADGEGDTADLLRDADVAMYEAKGGDKGGWRVFEPVMLTRLLHRHQMRASLVQAIERDEFIVHYQPIVNLIDGSVHGAEALVRWQHPDGRIVPPGQFITIAEETGLIAEIDQLVLRRACDQAARWQRELSDGAEFSLHVNVSARELHRPDLVTDVDRVLRESGLRADLLTLEITESGLGQNHEAAIQRLNGLTQLGVHLAIDDFGTGYSSLAYLRRMPVDVLKIDKTFTDELLVGTGSAPLARAVVVLANTLNMQTVAEGIEEPVQARRLLDLGCQLGQGFHFGRPLTAAQMHDLLRRGKSVAAVV